MMQNVPGSCGCPYISDKSIDFVNNPVYFIDSRISKYGRLFQVRVLNNPTVFVCSPRLIKELLCGEQAHDFCHGYTSILHHVFGDLILFESEEDALQLRQLLFPLFQRPLSQSKSIERLCHPYIASLAKRDEPVEIYSEFKTLMTRVCLELFLGLDEKTPDKVIDEISELATQHWHGMISIPVNVNLPFGGRSTFSVAVEAKNKLLQHIRDILRDDSTSRHQTNGDGSSLFSQLRELVFPKSHNLEQHILLFICAVIPKAFSSLITSFLLAMAGDKKKEYRARARSDPEFLDDVLLEVERMWPPLFAGRRLALRDTKVGDYKIPKDYALFYVTFSAHRDPDIFPNSNQFLPERWSTYNKNSRDMVFTFGAGRRRCIGTKFIRSILLSVMGKLLQEYNWSISPANQCLEYKFLPVARPKKDVTVAFHPLS